MIGPLPTFDMSLLATYYGSGANLRPELQAQRLRTAGIVPNNTGKDGVLPPWAQRDPAAQEEDTLARIFSSRKLLDPDDPLVKRHGDNKAFEQLFTLYRGLTQMRELVSYAETGRGADTMRTLLDRRFQDQLSQIRDYVSGLEIDGITLLAGLRSSELESTIATPKPLEKTLPSMNGTIVTDSRSDAVPGLAGTERFTIEVQTSTTSKSIGIDLANVTGTLNLDNIVNHINDELSANGVLTRLKVNRDSETAYGMRIEGVVSEQVSFTADAASESPAVYVAGSKGSGDRGDGFLRKLDGLDGAEPTTAFQTKVDSSVSTEQRDDAAGVAVDSQGNLYVVGTATGDFGAQVTQGTQDAYLRKYDASGNLVWTQLLGAAEDAQGFAVAVDGSDNVVVAGQTRSQLTATAYGGNADSFVTKFDSSGSELWTRQAAPYANDGVFSLTGDASGNIFIAGYARGAVDSSTTHEGGGDAYASKLDSDGNLVWAKQFGSAGDDRARGIAVDASGSVFVAAEVDGHAVLRKYDDDASQTPVWETDLGDLGSEGALAGLAIGTGGAIYLAGHTDNGALSGTITNAHSGGQDAFVSRVLDGGTSASVDFTSYVGTADTETGGGVAVRTAGASDEIFLTGSTTGTLGAQKAGETDGFVTKLGADGSIAWSSQFGGAFSHRGNAIAFDEGGTDVVSRLGLPTGPWPASDLTRATDLTSLRAGMNFQIAVNGGTPQRVTVAEGDSLRSIAVRINQVLGQQGYAELDDGIDGRRLNIEARDGARIDILPGSDGFDALEALGLRKASLFADPEEGAEDSIFELGMSGSFSVLSKQKATDIGTIIDNALREIRAAYKHLSGEETDANPLANVKISAADQQRINSLQLALDRLSGGGSGEGGSVSLFA